MHIERIVVGAFEVNCYVVSDDDGHAAVVDPGADAHLVLSCLERNELAVCGYLLTHGHVDHVSAVAELHDAAPAPIAIHAADLQWAFSETNQMAPFYGPPRQPPQVPRALEDGDQWSRHGMTCRVLSTPGHSPGSVCFCFDSECLVFSGDLLFAGSIGRTDLPGGKPELMGPSLERICGLPDETVVYPGHGPPTTIADERRRNPFLSRFASRRGAPRGDS